MLLEGALMLLRSDPETQRDAIRSMAGSGPERCGRGFTLGARTGETRVILVSAKSARETGCKAYRPDHVAGGEDRRGSRRRPQPGVREIEVGSFVPPVAAAATGRYGRGGSICQDNPRVERRGAWCRTPRAQCTGDCRRGARHVDPVFDVGNPFSLKNVRKRPCRQCWRKSAVIAVLAAKRQGSISPSACRRRSAAPIEGVMFQRGPGRPNWQWPPSLPGRRN